jgi:acyl-CoA thioesterase-1
MLDNRVVRHQPGIMHVCILSALMFFCLGIWGCDTQESTSTGIPEPMKPRSDSLVSRPQFPRAQSSAEPLAQKHESLSKIVAFGDSLTAGFGVSSDESYPAQLEKQLHEHGFHYEVVNAGVSGETSAGGVRRIEWILKSQPTVVILELGVNDGLRGLSLQQTYTNLRIIIERLQDEGVMVILAGMRMPPNYGEAYTGEFFDMYERLAQELTLPLIPFLLEGVAAQPGLNQADGIHPTAEGYALVAQNVLHTLEPLLKAGQSHAKEE